MERTYVAADGTGSFPADAASGVTGLLSPGGERMAALAGVHDSFARAQRLMSEMLGWAPDDDVIRRATHAAARRAAETRPGRRDAGRFRRRRGRTRVGGRRRQGPDDRRLA